MFGLSESAFETEEGYYKKKRFTEDTNPLRMISMNTKEGLMENFYWQKRWLDYRVYEIEKATGLSFTEWLEYPTYVLEEMVTRLKQEKLQREREHEVQMRKAKQEALTENFIGGSNFR